MRLIMTYQLAESRERRLQYHGNAIRELKIRLGLLEKQAHRQTKKKKKSAAGFTLSELLISISVFVILATLVLANFRRGGYSDDLRATADELVANIRRAQNLAVAGALVHYDDSDRDIEPGEIAPTPESIPPGGYGISVLWYGDEYTAFADFATCTDDDPNKCNNDHRLKCVYYPTPEKIDFRYDQYCDQTIESGTVHFRPNVRVIWLKPIGNVCGSSIGLSPIDITFQAPQPLPRINGEENSEILIELMHNITKQCRMITVDTTTGMVSQELESSCRGDYSGCH